MSRCAVDAAHERLASDAALVGMLHLPGQVYRHERPEKAPTPANKVWGRVIVKLPTNPYGPVASVIGRRQFSLRIHVDVADVLVDGYDPHRYAADVHQRVFERLSGYAPELAAGRLVLPIYRTADPDEAQRHPTLPFFASAATYLTLVDPA